MNPTFVVNRRRIAALYKRAKLTHRNYQNAYRESAMRLRNRLEDLAKNPFDVGLRVLQSLYHHAPMQVQPVVSQFFIQFQHMRLGPVMDYGPFAICTSLQNISAVTGTSLETYLRELFGRLPRILDSVDHKLHDQNVRRKEISYLSAQRDAQVYASVLWFVDHGIQFAVSWGRFEKMRRGQRIETTVVRRVASTIVQQQEMVKCVVQALRPVLGFDSLLLSIIGDYLAC